MKKLRFLPLVFSSLCLVTGCAIANNNSNTNPSSGEGAGNKDKEDKTPSDKEDEGESEGGEGQGGGSSHDTNPGHDDEGQGGESSEGEGGGTSTDDDPEVDYSAKGIQGSAILHAWNWSCNTIKDNLDNIKNAGYKVVQLSPMQPQKDKIDTSRTEQWWKLYQPYSFKIAGDNESCIGTAAQLKTLCTSAKAKGIKIIVDVVANHLAGNNGNFDGNVDSEIRDNNLKHDYTDNINGDNDVQNIVQGRLGGLPDLKTEDERIQNKVAKLLQDYLDAGVSGFRFDAAKHIETPHDNSYASNFWPNILNKATKYAEDHNYEKPYYYGEILNTPGNNRNWDFYTRYMNTLDNKQGNKITQAVNSGNVGSIDGSYNSGVNPNQLVIWAESHDTFANSDGDTKDIENEDIISKAYMIQCSRKDASTLYFARPGSGTMMGSIGSQVYKENYIAGANKFHNMYSSASEKIEKHGNVFFNYRGEAQKGVAIVNLGGESSLSVELGLPAGTYIDTITNRSYNVDNHKVDLNLTKGACFLIPDSMGDGGQEEAKKPQVSISANNAIFSTSTAITMTVQDAESASYSINGGSKVSFTDQKTITVGESESNGPIKVEVSATNNGGTTTKSLTVDKTSLLSKNVVVGGVPDDVTLLIWGWNGSGEGTWMDMTKEGRVYATDITTDKYIIVAFRAGTTVDTANWNSKLCQTNDLVKPAEGEHSIQVYSEIKWK